MFWKKNKPKMPGLKWGVLLLMSTLCYSQKLSLGVGRYGSWRDWRSCKSGLFAVGMILRSEESQGGRGDDTALNSVKLVCGNGRRNFEAVENHNSVINSHEGWYGSWRPYVYCRHGVIIGFRLRQEGNQGGKDDTATNNIDIKCSDGNWINGNALTNWGGLTREVTCGKALAVNSFRVKIENTQGRHDDTALNDVEMSCKDLPKSEESRCDAKDEWKIIATCDNSESNNILDTCSYKKTIGYSKTDSSHTGGHSSTTNTNSITVSAGISVGDPIVTQKSLSLSFQHSRSTTTGVNWSQASSETWSEETSIEVGTSVPPRTITHFLQAVGTCGGFSVKSNYIKRQDEDFAAAPRPVPQFSPP